MTRYRRPSTVMAPDQLSSAVRVAPCSRTSTGAPGGPGHSHTIVRPRAGRSTTYSRSSAVGVADVARCIAPPPAPAPRVIPSRRPQTAAVGTGQVQPGYLAGCVLGGGVRRCCWLAAWRRGHRSDAARCC
jgi:hypothetical protein